MAEAFRMLTNILNVSSNSIFSSRVYVTTSTCRRFLLSSQSLSHSTGHRDDDTCLFVQDRTFPPPNDESVRKYGMPLLARAAHNARMGRTLLYDLYDCPRRYHRLNHSRGEGIGGRDVDGGRNKIEYSYHDVLKISTMIHDFFKDRKVTEDVNSEHTLNQTSSQPRSSRKSPRIAFLCPPGPLYIATQWAAWSSGSIAVPLCTSHRSKELAYVLDDCDPTYIIDGTGVTSEGRDLRKAVRETKKMDRFWCLEDILPHGWFQKESEANMENDGNPEQYAVGSNGDIASIDSPALIIYTSGTTGNPKGVVVTHRNLYHQITDLVTAWGWSNNDAILHFLPLHHVHGIVNKLCCAVWAGGSIEFLRFNPVTIWERLAEASRQWKKSSESKQNPNRVDCGHDNNDISSRDENRRQPTLFMAVPTIYAKMLEVLPQLPPKIQPKEIMRQSPVRLMVSGSAALPTGIFNRWKELTGHTILERYGMTEFAMALSNPLEPIKKRLPGFVGLPLKSVEVKIVDEDTGMVIPRQSEENNWNKSGNQSQSGELCVRGPTVFSEYWKKPDATARAFDSEGYFRTGDVAEYDPSKDSYHILGRVSADIIKCGGHKLSSLQIERVLLEHPKLEEVVVLGVPDEIYGERVGLICRLKAGASSGQSDNAFGLRELSEWCQDSMSSYKIPTRMIIMEKDIPKNAMGKVSKKQLVHLFGEAGLSAQKYE